MIHSHNSNNTVKTDGGKPRITEIPITPGDILQTNFLFYESKYEYHIGRNIDPKTPEDLVLKNVYTPEEVRRISADIIGEFPRKESLSTQSALWVRAFAGFHFFYDANHRTAISTLRAMMAENGIEPVKPLQEFRSRTAAALDASKEERQRIDRRSIYEKDSLYEVWKKYFDDVLSQ